MAWGVTPACRSPCQVPEFRRSKNHARQCPHDWRNIVALPPATHEQHARYNALRAIGAILWRRCPAGRAILGRPARGCGGAWRRLQSKGGATALCVLRFRVWARLARRCGQPVLRRSPGEHAGGGAGCLPGRTHEGLGTSVRTTTNTTHMPLRRDHGVGARAHGPCPLHA